MTLPTDQRVRFQINETNEGLIQASVLLIIFMLRGMSLLVQEMFRDGAFLDPFSFRQY